MTHSGQSQLTKSPGRRRGFVIQMNSSHWNPSYTESLPFPEFIAGEKDKLRPEPGSQPN
jgi:hypothetical protein